MKYEVKIVKTAKSRLGSVDFDNLIFGRTMSDHMFMADYIDGQWTNLQIVPFGPIPMAPSMMALHYGQSRDKGGPPLLSPP